MRFWMIGLAASLVLGTAAHARYQKWGPWQPGKNLGTPSWAKGADRLVNRKERVDGHMLNFYDRFQYRGDTKALNAFLVDLEKVEGPKTIYFLGPEVNLGFINPRLEDADWSLSLSANSHVGMFIPVDGPNPIRGLKFPASISLEWTGEVGPEVKQLVEKHERAREALPKK
jgi:hypothetical protein